MFNLQKKYDHLKTFLIFKYKRIQFGKAPYCYGRFPIINNEGKIEIGDKFRSRAYQLRVEITCYKNAVIIIGNNVGINQGVTIAARQSIIISDNALLGDQTAIYDTSFHDLDEVEKEKRGPVFLDENVWTGRGVIILPGVSIGKNSVIGAGSVVTRNIPPNSFAAGNPAKVIKKLNCSEGFVRD